MKAKKDSPQRSIEETFLLQLKENALKELMEEESRSDVPLDQLWAPRKENKPQQMGYISDADILGFGGSAGGGKSDLLLGLATTKHHTSLILRREGKQLRAMIDRSRDIIGNNGRFNENTGIWSNLPGDRRIELGGVKDPADVHNYKGRPKDLLGIDEADMFSEWMIRILMGWVRTTDPNQKCRTVLTFNPPSSAEGRWVLTFFGPWIDPKHPNPAKPGELRWYAMVQDPSGEMIEIERPDGQPFQDSGETITPKSRTFIPSRVTDNPDLMRTGYMATLQALPEPYRSQLLKGDFTAGLQDDAYQTIPTEWVKIAQGRWKDDGWKGMSLSSLGCDPALGGADNTSIARRWGPWFARILKYPGAITPDGAATFALIIKALDGRTDIPVYLDVIGIGSATITAARMSGQKDLITPVTFSAPCKKRSRNGTIALSNWRAYAYWSFREALDPQSGDGLALPPDPLVLADLTAPRYELRSNGVVIEDKKDIRSRIGRSPDCADAIVLAHLNMTTNTPFVMSVGQPRQDNKKIMLP